MATKGTKTTKSKSTSKKSTSKKPNKPLLTHEQQQDLLGVCLIAIAIFLTLALVPTTWFGGRGGELFPSGNAMGPLGAVARDLLRAFLGSSAIVVPALIGMLGLRAGDWLSPVRSYRLGSLVAGLAVLMPVGFFIWNEDPGTAGWLGQLIGEPLTSTIGWLGASLVEGAGLIALSVLTVGWNPLRTLAKGAAAGGELAQKTVTAAGERITDWQESRAAAQAAAEAARLAEAEPLPGAEWTGPETGDDEVALPKAGKAKAGATLDDAASGQKADKKAEPVDAEASEADKAGADGVAASTEAAPEPVAEEARMSRGAPTPQPEDEFPDPADPRDLEGGELPTMNLLTFEESRDRAQMLDDLNELGQVLVEKLKTFNVQSELGGMTVGPMVTQFEIVPAPGVKVNRIANLDADLALAMRAQSIRIVAPIPGKGAVGVEIPNPEPEMVYLREILESREYRRAKGVLPLALGKDLSGRAYVADLAKMPHVLIAGATGAGKSVCINTIITSLVYKHTPQTLRLLMIDPKMVELSAYTDLPHLRHKVVTDPQDAAGVLKWAVMEMERRYTLLSVNGVRSLAEFNKKIKTGKPLRRPDADRDEGDPNRYLYKDGPLPYIVVVVDELADLMMQVQSEVEKPLAQLAQKARAIGIHLIVATQRPSVNVITGLIKANFPTRIAFRVASKTDSRTILDMNGAEALLGNGDMLFLPPGASEAARIQGAFISTEDTDHLLSWYRALIVKRLEDAGMGDLVPKDEIDILDELRSHEMEEAGAIQDSIATDWDELFKAAAETCIQNQGGSTSLLQRRLSIGYGRAARIVDQLQDAGVLGPSDGSKPREVLISMSEIDKLFPGL